MTGCEENNFFHYQVKSAIYLFVMLELAFLESLLVDCIAALGLVLLFSSGFARTSPSEKPGLSSCDTIRLSSESLSLESVSREHLNVSSSLSLSEWSTSAPPATNGCLAWENCKHLGNSENSLQRGFAPVKEHNDVAVVLDSRVAFRRFSRDFPYDLPVRESYDSFELVAGQKFRF